MSGLVVTWFPHVGGNLLLELLVLRNIEPGFPLSQEEVPIPSEQDFARPNAI